MLGVTTYDDTTTQNIGIVATQMTTPRTREFASARATPSGDSKGHQHHEEILLSLFRFRRDLGGCQTQLRPLPFRPYALQVRVLLLSDRVDVAEHDRQRMNHWYRGEEVVQGFASRACTPSRLEETEETTLCRPQDKIAKQPLTWCSSSSSLHTLSPVEFLKLLQNNPCLPFYLVNKGI